jgi:hypothetical protein
MGVRRRVRPVEVVELDERSRLVLARRHPEVVAHGNAIVVGAAPELRPTVQQAIEALAAAANQGERDEVERLVEKLLPDLEVVSPHAVEEAKRQARVRSRILRDFGAWTAGEVADLARSTAANRSSLAGRWRAQDRIFGVPYRGAWFYLAFQFGEDGRPLPVICEVVRSFTGLDAWSIASWFVVANPGLDRRRPVDQLRSDPEAVTRAARADAAVHRNAPRHTEVSRA